MKEAPAGVLAFGGNALIPRGGCGSFGEQQANVEPMARAVRGLLAQGLRVVITHGNGPQVGNLALQQEEAAATLAPQPLWILGAMTQGQIGHLLALGLERGTDPVHPVALVSHVVVDPSDPAFDRPTKPIGPFFTEEEARRLAGQRGWQVVEDSGRGYRRVVASPQPQEIVESDAIRALVSAGRVVIAAGGGGIPVTRRPDGRLDGIDAVIDKDLVAGLLAELVGARVLALITDVSEVAIHYRTPREQALDEMTVDRAEAYFADGQFPPGSMGPKISAAIRFLRGGGEVAVITNAENVAAALAGHHGTRVVAAPQAHRQAAAR
jgi:carbamate kinase